MSSYKLYAVDKETMESTEIGGRFTEADAKNAAKDYATANNLKITRGVQIVRNFSVATGPDDFRYTFLVTPQTTSVSKSKSLARGKRRTVGKRRPKKRSVRRLK